MLSLIESKKIINSIFEEKAVENSNTTDLANSLAMISDTVFGESNRFIFELLQNADDSFTGKDSESNDIEVEIILIENFLIFRHNGSHFNENDIRTISSVGNKKSDKKTDEEKIGYKGIGFKSVFKVTDIVFIISYNSLFRYDRNYKKWKNNEDYPWQIIPIWTENSELPESTVPYINESYVNFIIELKDREKIKEQILETLNDAKLLLFLHNIKRVHFYEKSDLSCKIELKDSGTESKNLYKNDKLDSEWLTRDFIFDIDEDLRTELLKLPQSECPDKLKNAKKTNISLSIPVKKEKIIESNNNLVYAFLPTTLNIDLPFIVNASFLTNAERTNLLDNVWNRFLIRCIAEANIKYILYLLENEAYKYQVLKILKCKYQHTYSSNFPSFIRVEFYKMLETVLENYNIIPQYKSDELINVANTLVDLTSLSDIVNDEIIMSNFENKLLADTKLENAEKLKGCGSSIFNYSDIFKLNEELLLKYLSNIENSFVFIEFIYLNTIKLNNENLKNFKFILDSKNELKAPRDIYFKPDKELNTFKKVIDLNFINYELQLKIETNIELKKWLKRIGVREPNDLEVIRKSIFKMIENDEIEIEDSVSLVQFLFKVYKSGFLNDNDYECLKKLKVKTQKSSFVQVSKCHLADQYDPQYKLETELDQDIYISSEYISDENEISKMKSFFLKIGASENLRIWLYSIINRDTLGLLAPAYLTYLDRIGSYPYETARYKFQHTVSNFLVSEFILYTVEIKFSVIFWNYILNNWSRFRKYLFESVYHTQRSNIYIPSLLSFIIKHHNCLPGTDHNMYKKGELYSNKLKDLLSEDFPSFFYKGDLSEEQEKFFGIINNISMDDCIKLLESFSKSKIIDHKIILKIKTVYEYLLKYLIKSKNLQTNETIKLISTNNNFIDSINLYCVIVDKIDIELKSDSIIRFPIDFSKNQIELLCNYFKIKIIKYSDLEKVKDVNQIDTTIYELIENKLKYISVIESKLKNVDPEGLYNNLIGKLKNFEFHYCSNIRIKYSDGDQIIFEKQIKCYYDNNTIFYSGNMTSIYTIKSILEIILSKLNLDVKIDDVLPFFFTTPLEIQNELLQKNYDITFLDQSIVNEDIEDPIISLMNPNENIIEEPEHILSEDTNFEKLIDGNYYQDIEYSDENEKYFTENENEKFIPKIISILKSIDSPWAGYIYHFTSLDNAIKILAESKIYCRNMADFKNSAGLSFISGTSEVVKNHVRFYFRPLTPTQYYNEDLGSVTKRGDLPQCPAPIMLRFKIEDVFDKYHDNCFVSNGNLKDYPAMSNFGNTYEFLKTMDFCNLFKRINECRDKYVYLRASQQEFIIPQVFDFSDIDYKVICKNEQDKFALLNLVKNIDNLDKIIVDSALFYNSNQSVAVRKKNEKHFEIRLPTLRNIEKEFLSIDTPINLWSIKGDIISVDNNEDYVFHVKTGANIEFKSDVAFKVYYNNNGNKWIIYKYGS